MRIKKKNLNNGNLKETDSDSKKIEVARSEIVARACEDMLSRSKVGKEMFNSLSQKEQKTLVEKIKDIIQNLKDWVSEALGLYENASRQDEAKILRAYQEELDRLSKLWDEMLLESVEVNQAFEKSGAFKHDNNVEGEVLKQAREIDDKGNSYWQIETDKDIFKGIDNVKGLQDSAYNYILNGYKGNKVVDLIDGKNLKFIRVSAREFVYGEASKDLTTEEYKQKMRMSTSIIDLIENASIEYDAPDHKNHKLFPNGFKNYQGRVGIDETIFKYIVRVGQAKNGMIFYDINLEVDGKVPRANRTSLIKSSTSNNSIHNSNENVKENLSDISTENEEIRYSKRDAVNPKRITLNMSETERVEILRNKTITDIPEVKEVSANVLKKLDNISSWQDINNLFGKDKRQLIHKIAQEFGVFKEYNNLDINISFEFSNNNFRETYGKQKRNYESFAKMFSVFDKVIKNAIGIEVHNRNDEGYKPDMTLKNVYVLISAFGDGEAIVPVKLEVKEFKDKQNTLYIAVSLEAIKKTEVSKQGTTENSVAQNSRSVTISLPDIFAKVNPKDTSFLKYIPNEFLNDEQIKAKTEALEIEKRKYSKKLLYSKRDTKSIYDTMGETERIKKENEKLKADVERLNERLKLEKQVTHGNVLNDSHILKAAGHLRNIASSSIDKVQLARNLKSLYTFIAQSENLTWEEVYERSYRIAESILEESKPEIMVDDYSKMIYLIDIAQ